MPDDWQDHDFNGGEWWQQWPPPPGGSDDYYESFSTEGNNTPDFPLPIEPNYPTIDSMLPGQMTGDQSDAFEYLVDIDAVEPSQIRGIAFQSYYEAVEWLQAIGLLGFSSVVFSGGFYYPAIGESHGIDDPAVIPPDD